MVTFVEEATIEKDSFQPFVILYMNDNIQNCIVRNEKPTKFCTKFFI